MPTIRRPSPTRLPRALTANAAVDPDPRPTIMPSVTCVTADSAAAIFNWFSSWLMNTLLAQLIRHPSLHHILRCERGVSRLGMDSQMQMYESANMGATQESKSEERRVGKECRSRWSPYH